MQSKKKTKQNFVLLNPDMRILMLVQKKNLKINQYSRIQLLFFFCCCCCLPFALFMLKSYVSIDLISGLVTL